MAKYIAWKEFYSVNDPSLDAEHKQIIECINDLYATMQSVAAGSAKRQVLDKLVQYTQNHFTHEEARLKEVGFPNFEAHKALHDNMRQRTLGLRTHLTLVTARDVLVFLKDWWVGHIQGEDKVYASYMPTLVAQ
jgi:hemerythrin-like metal-binding protein